MNPYQAVFSTESRTGGPAAPPAAEREKLEQYARDQFEQIREAREALAAEKVAAEKALEKRRHELETQSAQLVARLQDLNEREKKIADQLEDALPERHRAQRTSLALNDIVAQESAVEREMEDLRKQVREQQLSLELLGAERDAAWSQLQQYRGLNQHIEELKRERDDAKQKLDALRKDASSQQAGGDSELRRQYEDELHDLRDKLDQQTRQLEQQSAEREQAGSLNERVQELEQQVNERDTALERVRSEREEALAHVRALSTELEQAQSVDLGSGEVADNIEVLEEELHNLRQQLLQQRKQIEELQAGAGSGAAPASADNEELRRRFEELNGELRQQIAQIAAERDAAREQLAASPELEEAGTLREHLFRQKQMIEQLRAEHERVLDATGDRHREQIAQLISERDAALSAQDAAAAGGEVAALREQLAQTVGERDQALQDLEQAAGLVEELDKLREELTKANADRDAVAAQRKIAVTEAEELREQLAQLATERDQALAKVQSASTDTVELDILRDQVAQLTAERDAARAVEPAKPAAATPAELIELRRHVAQLKKVNEELQAGRVNALSSLNEQHRKKVEQLTAERDAARGKPADSAELSQLRAQNAQQKQLIDKLQAEQKKVAEALGAQQKKTADAAAQFKQLVAERDDAKAQLQKVDPEQLAKLREQNAQQKQLIAELRSAQKQLAEQQKQQLEQLAAERDAALAGTAAFGVQAGNWQQEEAEFAALRLQLKEEKNKLAEDAQAQHRREAEMRRQLEDAKQAIDRDRKRQDQLSVELDNLSRQLREDRGQLEIKERELRLRDAQLHLRDAEIREMVSIAELDSARERNELHQERLRLARLREAIRLEREALKGDAEQQGRKLNLPTEF